MSRAAQRRKARREQYLARLATTDPNRFHAEWNKRIVSWAGEIWKGAGLLVDGHGESAQPVFRVVDKATGILSACGTDAVALAFRDTKETLANECCRALATHVDGRLYRITVPLRRK